MSAEYEYLSPNFDPASLTVPKLRSILVEHEVHYPSSAKKPDLITLFNEQVIPKAKRILDKQARAKRSSRGIENISSSQVSVATAEEEEQDLPAPLSSPTKRTSRRTTRGATAETEPAGPISAVNGSAIERRTSTRAMRSSEPLPEPEPAPVRRGRKSAVTPSIKLEEEKEPEAWHRYDDTESPFSRENPFQSGSSPSGVATSPNRRRTTLGPGEHKETRKSTSGRRKTDFVRSTGPEEGAVVPARRTVELPISRVKQEEEEEAGEEFTPDAQEELALEQLSTGREVMPARRTRRKGTPALFSVAPLVMGLAIFGGGFTVWRQEKVEVGYCGLGREPSTQLAGVDIPEWASALQPQCEPCPPHAICRPNFEAICEPDFVLQPHPLSLGGLVPLPPSCEPDGEKQKKIKMVADRAVEELRERNAKYECGELVDEKGKQIRTPEIAEEQLKATISLQRRKGLSQEEFEDLWRAAIGEITNRDEVTSKVDGTTNTLRLASSSLAKIPLSCAVRRSIRLTLERYIWQLIGIILVGLSASYGRYTITYNRKTEEIARQLAGYAMDKLAIQASLHAQDPSAYPESYVQMNQLRDDVLRDEFSASRRAKLWEKVQKKVEQNSNIRPAVREGRHGDVSRCWEWIGAVQAIEDGGSGRKSGGRESLGLPYPSPSTSEGHGKEMAQVKKWEEPRPYF